MLGIQSYQIGNHKFNKNQKFTQNPSFGRALTSDERKISNILLDRTNQINAVDLRAMVMPGAATPAYTIQGKDGKPLTIDTGVGSPFSKGAQDHILFSKDLMGINAVQQLPLGALTPGKISPFNASAFEKGAHLLDPTQLLDMKLVDEEDVKALNVDSDAGKSTKNNYDNFFQKENVFFEKAHENFKKQLETDADLKKQYTEYLEHPVYSQWLEKKAVVTALADNIYGNDYYIGWQGKKANNSCSLAPDASLDKILFSAKDDPGHVCHSDAKARYEAIQSDKDIKNSMDLFKFKQFIAHKQISATEKKLEEKNVLNISDVPIGVHFSDTYGFHDAFDIDINAHDHHGVSELGCPGTNWAVPALKANSAEAVNFNKLKFRNELENYSGSVRLDAAWQLKTQYLYPKYETNPKVIQLDGQGYIPSVIDAAKESKKPDAVKTMVAENLCNGYLENDAKAIYHEKGIPQIIKLGGTDVPPNYWGTRGIHDQASLLSENLTREQQNDTFAGLLKGQCGEQGPRKVLFTFLDLFGRGERYNGGSENWMPRQPQNFEEEYYKNLAGQDRPQAGLNAFKSTKRAMEWKGIIKYDNGKLINNADKKLAPDAKIVAELLQHFENIVEEKGVYTTADADAKSSDLLKGLHDNFGKKAVDLLVDGYAQHANKPDNELGLKKLMIKVAKAVEEHRKIAAGSLVDSDATQLFEEVGNSVINTAPSVSLPVAAAEEGKEVTKAASSSFKHGKLVAIGGGIAVVGGLAAMYYSSQKKAEEEARKKRQVNHKKQYA